jgi:hypothetical protein
MVLIMLCFKKKSFRTRDAQAFEKKAGTKNQN